MTEELERNQAYSLALAAAKSEHDELLPEFQKLSSRMAALKSAMRGLSMLLNEQLEEEYQFRPMTTSWAGNRTTNDKKAGQKR